MFKFMKPSLMGTMMKQINNCRFISYVQGQSPDSLTREYFYFIDHQGMLYLDDTKVKNFTSCFKEKHFLKSFFRHLEGNSTGKYEVDFPFVFAPNWKETYYVRCEDLPIVFTHIEEVTKNGVTTDYLSYGNVGPKLKFPFQPDKIVLKSGRLYHPGPTSTGGYGLISSSLAEQLSSALICKDDDDQCLPSFLLWRNKKYALTDKFLPLPTSQKENTKMDVTN